MVKKHLRNIIALTLLTAGMVLLAGESSAAKKSGNKLSAAEKRQGWQLMFDGKSFTNWRGYNRQDIPPVWIIDNGTIKVDAGRRIEGDRTSTGDIIFDKQFKNFEFAFEWMISEVGNSGIFFLGQEIQGRPIYRSAPEYQLLDNANHPDAKQGKDNNRMAASLYDMIPAVPQNAKPFMQWNSGKIVVNNGKVEHYQNGVKVVEYTLWTPEWLNLIENSKFKGWEEMINVGGEKRQGYIGLQYHGDDIWFRNLKIREL